MKLKRVGFFSDLPYGDSHERPIGSYVDGKRQIDQSSIVSYLNSGHAFVVSPGLSRDVLRPEKIIGSLAMLTDGKYVWPSDLAYYVVQYKVELPEDFIAFMREHHWLVPEVKLKDVEM